MDRALFGKELTDLALNFGVPMNSDRWDRRMDFLYQRLKHVDDQTFKRACEIIGMRGLRFPTLAEIFEAVQNATPIGWVGDKSVKINCAFCENTGYLTALKDYHDATAEYVFRCVCDLGRVKAEAVPVWHRSWKAKGYRLRKEELDDEEDISREFDEAVRKLVEKTAIAREEAPF